MEPVVFVLHGVADRNSDELVCMFFSSVEDRTEFEKALPGKYAHLSIFGISYDDMNYIHSVA